MTEETFGDVFLSTPGFKKHPEFVRYLVRRDSSGDCYYYLGAAARTSDGWVPLPADQVTKVAWRPITH